MTGAVHDDIQSLKSEIRKRDTQIQKLEGLVAHDSLTGLLNRRGFLRFTEKFFKHAEYSLDNPNTRRQFSIESFSILFFDIDNFKNLNDTYGHKIGDQILKFVASVIEGKVRTSDFVGRWGGEEIVVALIGSREEDAYRKAEEIRQAIKSRVKIPTLKNLEITVSAGVTELKSGLSLDDLITKADEAMYYSKSHGKDKVTKFSDIEK